MLPVAAINNPAPVPIVNTTLPGTVVMHVPYDNVAPSISSAQVNNNASPNSDAATAAEDQPQASQAAADAEEQAAASITNTSVQNPPGAQATFLAQLLSQDASPPVQTILLQYEKLMALSNVKYKPSNASKPVAEPSSTFGKLLQENRPAAVQPVTSPQPASRQPVTQPSVADQEEAVLSSPALDVPAAPRQQQRNVTSSANTTTGTQQNNTPQISAYTQTAARVDAQSADLTTELA